MSKRSRETRLSWSVDSRSSEGHGLLGRGWFEWPPPPDSFRFYTYPVLFRTRREARESLDRCKQSFPKARVVRVKVTVEYE